MNWNDTGFLLSKNKYNENSIIVDVFTNNHGKISGIIFGRPSKKIKNVGISKKIDKKNQTYGGVSEMDVTMRGASKNGAECNGQNRFSSHGDPFREDFGVFIIFYFFYGLGGVQWAVKEIH